MNIYEFLFLVPPVNERKWRHSLCRRLLITLFRRKVINVQSSGGDKGEKLLGEQFIENHVSFRSQFFDAFEINPKWFEINFLRNVWIQLDSKLFGNANPNSTQVMQSTSLY